MKKITIITAMLAATALGGQAQSLLYPKHFDLQQVTLLDGPMKKAMYKNIQLLMQYDVDRLLTPFVRESGLDANAQSTYYQWTSRHPNFKNWGGDAGFDLSGHVGGHYLSALAMGYAACHDEAVRQQLKERMDYMLKVMKDCQDNYDQNTEGLYGFIGGQPILDAWTTLYKGDIQNFRRRGGWVPFYCEHKVLAGLRDAYLYGGSKEAKQMFRKLADWSVNLISKVSDQDMETMLGIEHGGMNESMIDAYQIFGDKKYLEAARKYTHKQMLNGMQTMNKSFLDNKHANTQVPKYIGMERIGEEDATATEYLTAATNFWTDVTQNRTVCIGGNSVNEHFLAAANSNRYIDQPDGPESCNTNNMMKLTEMMSDRTGDAKFADFYENAMWNHILSTQDPETGGYVYFTTLRPQAYRIYSKVNEGMWCCVGTGMENHSKYGHFIYTHNGKKTLFINLFTPSSLNSRDFNVKQETDFPYEPGTTLTIGKAGKYTIAVRHPSWTTQAFAIKVNGQPYNCVTKVGEASYVHINRKWKKGDKVEISLPMTLRYEECPNYNDYIAFKYGPILLAAQTSQGEKMQNEYGGEGRMDHSPGVRGSILNLTSAPMLIGQRADVLSRIKMSNPQKMQFTIDASRKGASNYRWTTLTLQPFYEIQHARYSCYWYQQTEEGYQNSTMAADERAAETLKLRTIDFVAVGEQQSEAGHVYNYSSDSQKGSYKGETYRDTQPKGYVQFTLANTNGAKERLAIMLRFINIDRGRMATLSVDGVKLADITIPRRVEGADNNGFFNMEFPLPATMMTDAKGNAKKEFTVRLTASDTTLLPGLYYMRLVNTEQ
jgi:DUF1680 family protein